MEDETVFMYVEESEDNMSFNITVNDDDINNYKYLSKSKKHTEYKEEVKRDLHNIKDEYLKLNKNLKKDIVFRAASYYFFNTYLKRFCYKYGSLYYVKKG